MQAQKLNLEILYVAIQKALPSVEATILELYTDSDRPHYDSSFKREVEMRVKGIKEEIASDRNSNSTHISIYDV